MKEEKGLPIFENHVGKLNEVCTRRRVFSPEYIVSVTENGEFIIQCKMFDNSVTQGRSKSKKEAKHKSAEAMLQILNEREEARCQQFSEFNEGVENFSIPTAKATKNVNIELSSSAESLTNHVGKLNEKFKKYQKHPKYRICGTESGEFIIECKICDNTITRGRSKSRKDAKQKAAEAMLLILNHSQESPNKKEESMCSNHLEFIKPTKNVTEPFENHVEIINKISSTTQMKQSLDNPCEIFDNTREQPTLKIDTVEALNNNEDSRNDEKETQWQRYVEIINCAKNLTNSILSIRENSIIKLSSSVESLPETENGKLVTECTIVEQPTFKNVEKPKAAEVLVSVLNNSEKCKYDRKELGKDREESMNDEKKSPNQKVMQLIKRGKNLSNTTGNLTENGSIRLSAPTDSSNEIYYKSKKKYLSNKVCKSEENPELKAALTVLNASDKWKNDAKASRCISKKLTAKKISNSTLNVTDKENFRLSSEQFENHMKTREETYYKNKKKPFSHRVYGNFYSEESRQQKHVKVIKSAKDLTSPILNTTGNVSHDLTSSTEQLENNVGKLNKTFYKGKKHFLRSACTEIDNDELATFEDAVIQEQSEIKKDLKPKVSDVLLDLLSDSETLRNDREELIRQKHMEFYKCAKNYPISSLNVRRGERLNDNSRTETFENYVKKLNEEYGKKINQRPWYRSGETKSGKFIVECIINNTITRGQSRYKKEAKQKAAKEMLKILAESGKQKSMVSLEEYNVSNNQRKLLLGLGTATAVERNEVPAESPNESTTLVTNPCRLLDNTSSVQFENYVGKLNEICFKETLKHPLYTTFEQKSGEFIIKCEMFDKTSSHGCSTTKKGAKQEAAKAMIQMISKGMCKYQRQQDTKSFHIGKFSEFLSNVTEKTHFCSQADMPSSSTDENDNLLESSIDSFENHVGKLNDFCSKSTCQLPTYIEHVSENSKFTCECVVINDDIETVTQGRSMLRKDAKQKAAQEMIKILTERSKLEHQSLMTSVTIIDTTDCSQQKSIEELHDQILVKQSDSSSLEHMNAQDLKMELKDLNISYTITAVRKTTNALKLKTKRTADYKSLTFISTGESRLKISLNLLRKAVFGLRILKK